jgi:hypothetical protein
MGYYTIKLDPMASEICTIIFPWGKYSYKRLPTGFGGSADIFQAQIMDLMASLKFVLVYMNNLSIITRGVLDEHLQKMETVLTRLCDAGLKVNAAKSLFCAHEIEYLGYILTIEGIKPQPMKVQAILALNPPNNVKELRHFLGMVQYPQLRRAPKELPESSQRAPRELPSPSLNEICVLISLSKTADKQSFLGTTWRF